MIRPARFSLFVRLGYNPRVDASSARRGRSDVPLSRRHRTRATMGDRGWHLRGGLLAALLAVTALAPPELSPTGLALSVTLAAGAGLLVLSTRDPLAGVPAGLRIALPVVLLYLFISVFASSQPHRSLSCLTGAGIGLVAFALGRGEGTTEQRRTRVLGVLTGVASLAAAEGIYQKYAGLQETARMLRRMNLMDGDAYILRAESGRAFGPFLLPSALGIYLALVIPITLRLLIRSRRGGKGRFVWAGLLLIQLAGVWASLSYGAVISLLAAALILLPIARIPRLRLLIAAVTLLGVTTAGLFFALRAGEESSPLLLRTRNWVAALRVISERPLLGVGLGNFADAYPKHLGPRMNETSYVHNSYLQVAAEGGILGLVGVVYSVGSLGSLLCSRLRSDPDRVGGVLLFFPFLTFLVHNLVDFSAYLPSLTTTFAALAGLGLPAEGRFGDPEPGGVPCGGVGRAAFLCLLLGGAAWGVREAWTRSLIETGRQDFITGKLDAGVATLTRAAHWDPADPDPPAVLAEAYLSEVHEGPEPRNVGEFWARLAVRIRPQRAYGHYVMAMYRLAAGDRGEAWVELSQARLLFPERDLYRCEEARLRELVLSGPPKGSDGGH